MATRAGRTKSNSLYSFINVGKLKKKGFNLIFISSHTSTYLSKKKFSILQFKDNTDIFHNKIKQFVPTFYLINKSQINTVY
jgi:hypothetical protein